MSSDIVVQARGLSKCYCVYRNPQARLAESLRGWLCRSVGRPAPTLHDEVWSLRDVSFRVRRGEAVGIVGRNGSGKSTLLQLICGTLDPTSGSVYAANRMTALLELGSGFNPEFTGRENVYLNASLAGMSRAEITRRFPEITRFADIGEFIDRPLKTFSSGMVVRLAFAVATSMEPELLVVDEALSVGDELFQRKCFARIEELRRRGTSLLFVSHSGSQVIDLCDRAILLEGGELVAEGDPRAVIKSYQRLLYSPAHARRSVLASIARSIEAEDRVRTVDASSLHSAAGVVPESPDSGLEETYDPELRSESGVDFESHGPRIGMPELRTMDGRQVNGLVRGRTYLYTYEVFFSSRAKGVRFGMAVRTPTGVTLAACLSAPNLSGSVAVIEAGTRVTVTYRFRCSLNTGTYFTNAGVFGQVSGEESVLHRRTDVIAFRVLPIQHDPETGPVSLEFVPEVQCAI